jgi:hypothetical protein
LHVVLDAVDVSLRAGFDTGRVPLVGVEVHGEGEVGIDADQLIEPAPGAVMNAAPGAGRRVGIVEPGATTAVPTSLGLEEVSSPMIAIVEKVQRPS